MSYKKIEIARRSINQHTNIRFIQAGYVNNCKDKFVAITMTDVLYLLPFDEQKRILDKCCANLERDGLLIIKETYGDSSLRFKMIYFQELVMVRLLKRTMGGNGFYYRTLDGWKNLFKELGYQYKAIKLNTTAPSYLFLCKL